MEPARPDPPTGSVRASHAGWFQTTHWSVVRHAGGPDSTKSRAALEALCRAYWYPLYAFVRRYGIGPHDAEDLVQSFLAGLLARQQFAVADPAQGRFRTFLLVALKRFLANEWDKARARKRGGGQAPIPLDGLTAEQRYALEPADSQTADRLYDRRWALTLLDTVLARLRKEQVDAGKAQSFELLQESLTGAGRGTPYTAWAARLGMSEGAVKVAVHRLRQRYRQLLEQEIAQTVASPDDVATERRHLLEALSC